MPETLFSYHMRATEALKPSSIRLVEAKFESGDPPRYCVYMQNAHSGTTHHILTTNDKKEAIKYYYNLISQYDPTGNLGLNPPVKPWYWFITDPVVLAIVFGVVCIIIGFA